jgi:hypothetical protein
MMPSEVIVAYNLLWLRLQDPIVTLLYNPILATGHVLQGAGVVRAVSPANDMFWKQDNL